MDLPADQQNAVLSGLRGDDISPQQSDPATTADHDRWLAAYLRSKLPSSVMGDEPTGSGAKVIRDRFGVPHIFADSEEDLWCAAGFVQAQDRLWQMDYRHRVSTGTLAEVIGSDALKSDIENRTIGLRRAADEEFAKIDDRSGVALEAYARGVNKWIEITMDNLPVEFEVLGYQPAAWSPAASLTVLRHFWWSLTGRLSQIIGAERVLRSADPLMASLVLSSESAEYIVPDGQVADSAEGGGDDGTGSNNWVVGPAKTSSGMPALASDPHWPIHFPDLWYEQHLVSPGTDCIGAAYPGAPPVIFGRTRHAAWARTNNVTSTRDLYHEVLDPDDSNRYIDASVSKPLEVISETIDVKDALPHDLEIRLTSRGPVVNGVISPVDSVQDGPITLKWLGHGQINDMRAMIDLNCASSSSDVRSALSGWRLSVWNAVYADDEGDFGYQMSGSIPVRGRKTRGTRDASSLEDAWNGVVATDSLPGLHSPDRGWAGSANNTPAPPSLLGDLTGAYADGYRFRRIADYLGGTRTLSPESVRELQQDNLDIRAVDLKDPIAEMLEKADGMDNAAAARILRGWNCRFDADQSGATLWASLWPRFARLVGERVLSPHAAELMADSVGSVARKLILGDGANIKGDIDVAELLSSAASGALSHLRRTLGDDESGWTWDKAHTVRLVHPAARTPMLAELLNLGPFRCPGGGGTVNNRRPVECDEGFENASGVSYRLFVDFSEPGKAWGATLAGQSAQPGSPHYDDRVQETLDNEYHPLLMDPSDISREAEHEFSAPAFPECEPTQQP